MQQERDNEETTPVDPEETTPAARPEIKTVRWALRNPVVAALTAILLLVMAASLVWTEIKNREITGVLKDRDEAVRATPFGGVSLLPSDPINVWVNPATVVVFLNGFAAAAFVPTLAAGGFNIGPFPVPGALAGSGFSIMMQLIADAPGLNAVSLGFSDAVELQLL